MSCRTVERVLADAVFAIIGTLLREERVYQRVLRVTLDERALVLHHNAHYVALEAPEDVHHPEQEEELHRQLQQPAKKQIYP